MPVVEVERAIQGPPEERAARLISMPEDQWLERKSARVSGARLAEALIGMANADGGWVVVGLSDGQVEDVTADVGRLNGQQQAAHDFTDPTIRAKVQILACIDSSGAPSNILVWNVPPSDHVHHTKKGKCFYVSVMRRGL